MTGVEGYTFRDLFHWANENRDWLFQGIGLSLTLFVMGLLWQACKICGRLAAAMARGLAKLTSSSTRHLDLAAPASKSEAGQQIVQNAVAHRTPGLIVTPSPEEIQRFGSPMNNSMYNRSYNQSAPVTYSPSSYPYEHASRRTGGIGLTRVLIWLAVLNVLWVVVKSVFLQ